MALALEIQTRYGVPATYHKVLSAALNTLTNQLSFEIYSYASKETRDGGFQPLQTARGEFPSIVADVPEETIQPVLSEPNENGEQTVLEAGYVIEAKKGYTITVEDNLTKKAYELLLTHEDYKNATEI